MGLSQSPNWASRCKSADGCRRRDHGGVIFVDCHDRSGCLQCVFHPDQETVFAAAEHMRREYVIEAVGTLRLRPEGTINPELGTGTVELLVTDMTVLNVADVPALQIDGDDTVHDEVRMKHRVLDLRRDVMQVSFAVPIRCIAPDASDHA